MAASSSRLTLSAAELGLWGYVVAPLMQLLVGVLCLLQGLAALKHRPLVASA